MDFTIEVLQSDEQTRTIQFRAVPDARRYDRIEKDGEAYYLDKYLRLLISQKIMVDEAAKQLVGLPLYELSASIDSTPEYAAARKLALGAELNGGSYILPSEVAAPHRSIALDSTPKELVFLSVDICRGSALRRANRTKFDEAYRLFVRELGTLVGQFKGHIYKLTGDGFIAYIDHPAFTVRSDQAVDLGLSLLVMLRDSINPALVEADLPEFEIRIGADSGVAIFRKIEVPMTGFSDTEVGSDALNRAVKIQESAGLNEFRIGRDLYELIHVKWLERATEVPFDGGSIGAPEYRVYRVE